VPFIGIKSAVVVLRNQESEIQGGLQLTTAPIGVEMGQPFLVDSTNGTIYPMTSVKVMKR